jgi:ElaB/YqjD/DUF883 family membrane-anchored ribosome-binding protein
MTDDWLLITWLSSRWGCAPVGQLQTPDYSRAMNTREMTEKLQDWQKRASETARNIGNATDDYVRENTWTTIAVAALIGCVFGFFLANRRD